MAIRELPIIAGVPAFQFKVELDSRNFEFIFTFSDRNQTWSMNILDDAGDELLSGIPLLVSQFLIDKYQHDPRLPQGNLYVVNTVDENVNPTDSNLGSDVLVFYEDEDNGATV